MGHRLQARRFEELTVDECLRLLAGADVGRIAYVRDDEPTVLPVNFVLDEGSVVFRTTYGQLLDSMSSGARVAFEVDSLDAAAHSGWSVLVKGKAEEVWLPRELDEVRLLSLQSWAPGERTHYVRVFPSMITGRRIR